ncbi:MAG: flagellar export chaperone FliS [Thermoguttaceae bacterium]
MPSSMAQDHYLFTEVKTAAPQKLQLLLIEAALRLSNRARQYWQQDRNDLAIQALVNAQAVMAHMLGVIDHKAGGDLAKRVSAVYEFIFRSLVKAGHRHDEKSLGDAVRILEIERQTWRQLCEKLAAISPRATFDDGYRGVLPHLGDPDLLSQPGGFSVEA